MRVKSSASSSHRTLTNALNPPLPPIDVSLTQASRDPSPATPPRGNSPARAGPRSTRGGRRTRYGRCARTSTLTLGLMRRKPWRSTPTTRTPTPCRVDQRAGPSVARDGRLHPIGHHARTDALASVAPRGPAPTTTRMTTSPSLLKARAKSIVAVRLREDSEARRTSLRMAGSSTQLEVALPCESPSSRRGLKTTW